MALRARQLLKELITKHPDWNWEDLEDQGFVELMQAFRSVPQEDSTSLVLAFTVVKEYIRRFLFLDEIKRLRYSPKKLAYEGKLYNAGFQAGIKELQIRSKAKKTTIEKRYIEIADKFNIDIQTVSLIWQLVNGHHRTKEQITQWAKKQYPQTKLAGHPEYYRWLFTFLDKLSTEDFALFYEHTKANSEDYAGPVPDSLLARPLAERSTLALRTFLVYPKKKKKKVLHTNEVLTSL